jgi:hypothetical protein
MHEPIYRKALGSAWHLVMKHKLLWAFGLLSLLLGKYGWSSFLGQLAFFPAERIPLTTALVSLPWWQFFVGKNIVWSIWLFVIVLGLSMVVILASVAAEGTLIAAATSWYKGYRFVNLKTSWHRGVKHFWRLLGIHCFKKVLFLALLLLLNEVITLLLPSKNFFSVTLIIVLTTLGLFTALGIAVTAIFASGYVVEEEDSLRVAIQRGWELFHEHLLVSFEISGIFLAIEVVLAFVIASLAVWFLIPFVSLSLIAGFTGATSLVSAGLAISMLFFIVIIALVGGFLNAYIVSVWMYLYMKMHHEGISSRILHWFSRS